MVLDLCRALRCRLGNAGLAGLQGWDLPPRGNVEKRRGAECSVLNNQCSPVEADLSYIVYSEMSEGSTRSLPPSVGTRFRPSLRRCCIVQY